MKGLTASWRASASSYRRLLLQQTARGSHFLYLLLLRIGFFGWQRLHGRKLRLRACHIRIKRTFSRSARRERREGRRRRRWSARQRQTDHRRWHRVRIPPASGAHRYQSLSFSSRTPAVCIFSVGRSPSSKPEILRFNFSRQRGKCGTAATSRF